MCFLEQPALQDFSPSRCSVLPVVFLVTMVPCCLEIIDKILLCSSGLIPHRSRDHWNSTRWDLEWSPRTRKIDSYFVFLPFVNNYTNCCHLLTAAWRWSCSPFQPWVGLVPVMLGELFGLGHGGEFGIWLIDFFCGQVVFYTGNNLRLEALTLRDLSFLPV